MADKFDEIFPKYFSGRGLCLTHVGAPCCETWLKKIEVKFAIVKGEKKNKVRDFYLLGSYPLVGRHVVNESKIGCHVVSKLGIFLSRTKSGSFTYVYTRGLRAVEYLAKLSRIS